MTKTMYNSAKVNRLLVGAGVILAATLLVTAPFFAQAATLERQLQVGMSGTDVSALQAFLAKDAELYPQGLVTGYFGFLTKSAVSNFQSRNGIANVGRVGPQTLPVLNAQMAGGMIGGVDASAPALTSLGTSASNTSATVNWTTLGFSRGQVYYSTSPIRLSNLFDQTGINSQPMVSGTLAPYDSVERTSHSITINGLMSNTTYYYEVVALDSANNVAISVPASFHTAQ